MQSGKLGSRYDGGKAFKYLDKHLVPRYVEMSPHRSRPKVDLLVGAAFQGVTVADWSDPASGSCVSSYMVDETCSSVAVHTEVFKKFTVLSTQRL